MSVPGSELLGELAHHVLSVRGTILMRLGRLQDADDIYTFAHKKDPKNMGALGNRGAESRLADGGAELQRGARIAREHQVDGGAKRVDRKAFERRLPRRERDEGRKSGKQDSEGRNLRG